MMVSFQMKKVTMDILSKFLNKGINTRNFIKVIVLNLLLSVFSVAYADTAFKVNDCVFPLTTLKGDRLVFVNPIGVYSEPQGELAWTMETFEAYTVSDTDFNGTWIQIRGVKGSEPNPYAGKDLGWVQSKDMVIQHDIGCY